MQLIIACTARPCDGLFYYSYEYASHMNVPLVVIPHPDFTEHDYLLSMCKYTNWHKPQFEYIADPSDVVMVLGRSCMTIPWMDFKRYTDEQKFSLKDLFGGKVIPVYSENHPTEYYEALKYWNPEAVVDLCDTEIYPNGYGIHFEKRINFKIYKDPINQIFAEHMFLGTNREYYATAEKHLKDFPDNFILTYDHDYVNPQNNNRFAPMVNLLGSFNTYVYCKETFDPAPRLLQECIYFDKKLCYNRVDTLVDGGYYYRQRGVIDIDINPIEQAYNELRTTSTI